MSYSPETHRTRTLFPYGSHGLTERALEAALRLARVESGTLVPVFLALVPLRLPLDAPLPRQSAIAIPLQEEVEQRCAERDVAVQSRIERGRTLRHALRQAIEHEHFGRIVLAASTHPGQPGFGTEDVAWLLANAPGEILVLRPEPQQ